MTLIIGIGGASMAGKSTLAQKIRNWFPDKEIVVLCQDDFVHPEKEIPQVNNKTDWERPESVDFDTYIAHVLARSTEFDVVIAEGLFAYADTSLSNLYHKKIFIEIDESTFKNRKSQDTRWGKEPDWYVSHIWESYLKYGTLSDIHQDVFVMKNTGDDDTQKLKDYLLK